jgi:methionine-rich copper-binding protein CopC
MRSSSSSRDFRGLFVPVFVASVILISLARSTGHASAHSEYDHSTPAEDQVVATTPARIDVYFSEEMARSGGLPTLTVFNASGDKVDTSSALDDDDRKHMSADLETGLRDGRYTVIWHTLSADDNEEAEGAFHFYIGAGPSPSTTGGTPATTTIGSSRTATPAATPAPNSDDSGSDFPVWAIILGLAVGVVVGGGGVIAIGRLRSRG